MLKPHYERYKGKGKDLHPQRYEGYVVDLADKITEKTGMRYELHVVADGKYGTKDENGNWNGMVRELLAKVMGAQKQSFPVALMIR